MTFESGILTSLISAIVSAVTSYIINKYRDIENTKRNIKEQQLEKLYCPIMKIIDDYYSSYDNEESVGLDEDAVIKILSNINQYIHLADKTLINWKRIFEGKVNEAQRHIRPSNPEYDPYYDENGEFVSWINNQIVRLRKEACIEE